MDIEEISGLRARIEKFLQERLTVKLEKLKEGEDTKRQALIEQYQLAAWVEDAARRVKKLQLVTHALKYGHPDAHGTSLYAMAADPGADALVGTHSLREAACPPDVVGNAAYLDVYQFLKLEQGGRTLLERAYHNDPALKAALSASDEQAEHWMAAFAGITQARGQPASHKLAKQLYWPLPDGGYHLLAPLYPTSLVQAVYTRIREDRFSQASREARDARWNNKPHPHGYCEYPNLAIQNFGGSNPQNISQLNSERHGESYLLASLPPSWRAQAKPPLGVATVFAGWLRRRRRLRELTGALRDFLVKSAYNNRTIRQTRAALAERISDELLQVAAELHELEPGWSAAPACRLDAAEQYWLDPYRELDDAEFALGRAQGKWPDEIAKRFGNWLNYQLTRGGRLPMGDDEYHEWRGLLEKELQMIRQEVAADA
ncbi:MAG: type I-F CRISPR-associated protein Csy1 [Nitrococcus mobilis]|nr:type I-F CRISPR-associated protein Csy1 [Nitrococcus mobilis]